MSGVVKPSDGADVESVPRATGTSMQVLIGADEGAPRYITRKFTIAPRGRIPRHSHPDIEHEQYVLSGEMVVGIGETVHTARIGDALFIPSGAPHWYENKGPGPVEFLCIVPRTERYDTDWLE